MTSPHPDAVGRGKSTTSSAERGAGEVVKAHHCGAPMTGCANVNTRNQRRRRVWHERSDSAATPDGRGGWSGATSLGLARSSLWEPVGSRARGVGFDGVNTSCCLAAVSLAEGPTSRSWCQPDRRAALTR